MPSDNIKASDTLRWKVLRIGAFLPTTEAAVYTVPANTGIKIAGALVSNVSTTDANLTLSLVPAGETNVLLCRAVPGYVVPGGDSVPLTDVLAGQVMGPGDAIWALSSVDSALVLVASATVAS